MKDFQIKKTTTYYQLYYLGEIVKTHLGNELKFTSSKEAELLIEDYQNNFDGKFTSNHSLLFCYLATKSEHRRKKVIKTEAVDYYQFNLELVIQWDRVYRLSPGPPYLLWQMKYIEPIKKWLGEDYIDLPLNYCDDIEDLDDSEMVPAKIVSRIRGLIQEMPEDTFRMVDILFEYFDRVSPTLVIFWLTNNISTEQFVGAVYTFLYDIDVEPILSNRVNKVDKKDDSNYNEDEFNDDYERITLVYSMLKYLKKGMEVKN